MEYFNPDGFEYLYNSESQSFWFNARNKLIVWFLDKFRLKNYVCPKC